MELIEIMTDGTMKALVLHCQAKGITANETHLAKGRQVITNEWTEFIDTIKDATDAHMGDAMYRQILNTYCNSWAVKAIS